MKKNVAKSSILDDAAKVSKKFGTLTRDAYRAHGKFTEVDIAKYFGSFANLRCEVLKLNPKPQPEPQAAKAPPSDREILNGVVALLRSGPRDKDYVCNKLKIGPDDLERALVSDHLYCITELGSTLAIDKPQFDKLEISNTNSGEWTRYGLVADTHLACREERLDALHNCYDIFEAEGITTVLHAGNMVDGYIHKINGASVIVNTPDDQAQYVIDKYPRRDGITTLYITGDDHEGWWIKEGFNWGNYLQLLANQQGRTDLKYIGHVEGDLAIDNGKGKIILKVQHPGGGCFTEGAEIMTRTRGWVDFRDLTLDDEVATMHKESGVFEWQNPTGITNEHYEGDVYTFKSRTFDFTVTPNHGLWARHDKSFKRSLQPKTMPQKGHFKIDHDWQRIEAADLYEQFSRQKWAFRTTCDGWQPIGEPSVEQVPHLEPKNCNNRRNCDQMQHVGNQKVKDLVELIGWYVTEGSASHKSIVITQCPKANPENHARILALIERMGLRYSCSHENTSKNIAICSTELSLCMRTQCGVGSYHKRLPLWVKNLPTSLLKLLVEVMVAGDGWVDGQSFHYKSHSKQLRDDMAEIAQKAGFGVSTSEKNCTVHLRTVQNNPTVNTKPTVAHYSGNIYCATVPNGLIYVRMNGKAFWSHNSAYARSYTAQKSIEAFQGGEKPQILIQGHYHVSNYMNDRNIHVVGMPGFQDQTIFARKKRLRMEIGGAILEFKQSPNDGSVTRLRVEFIMYFDRGYYRKFLRSDVHIDMGKIVK